MKNFFYHIKDLHQNIKFTMDEERNGELAFVEKLLNRNNGKISVLVYTKATHTAQYLYYSNHNQASYKESINRKFSIITNKDDSAKENTRIKQV